MHFYKENMLSRLKSQFMTKEDIEAWHDNCFREANKYFKRMYIMGKEHDIKKIKENIIKNIDVEFQQFLLTAHKKNVFNNLFDQSLEFFSQCIDNNIDLLNIIVLKNALLIIIMIYM